MLRLRVKLLKLFVKLILFLSYGSSVHFYFICCLSYCSYCPTVVNGEYIQSNILKNLSYGDSSFNNMNTALFVDSVFLTIFLKQ
ncbi:hypothetical protein GDO86_013233 [Hymenochirus boettgeri]|uniref:Uncharacterized protein n=1 Tax=Hymenochirus boettgeri TaxID=247094 RepID=A0A8T2IVX1_9PIPI|nr:hypothetical protein GDO86_013233 [Hymenochirus boettgeri]